MPIRGVFARQNLFHRQDRVGDLIDQGAEMLSGGMSALARENNRLGVLIFTIQAILWKLGRKRLREVALTPISASVFLSV